MDSLGAHKARAKSYAKKVRSILNQKGLQLTETSHPSVAVKVCSLPLFSSISNSLKVPKQLNDYDCGTFVLCWFQTLANLEQLALHSTPDFEKLV